MYTPEQQAFIDQEAANLADRQARLKAASGQNMQFTGGVSDPNAGRLTGAPADNAFTDYLGWNQPVAQQPANSPNSLGPVDYNGQQNTAPALPYNPTQSTVDALRNPPASTAPVAPQQPGTAPQQPGTAPQQPAYPNTQPSLVNKYTPTNSSNQWLQGGQGAAGGAGGGLGGLTAVNPGQMLQGNGQMGQTDWSGLNKLDPGFGAVQEVQDAMMSRMNPQLEQQKEAEMQRLVNSGLTRGTEAWDRAMTRMDQKYNDANQQALLGGMTAYGDIFNRGLAGNQQEIGRQFGQASLDSANQQQSFGQNKALQDMLAQLRGQDIGYNTSKMQNATTQQGQGLNYKLGMAQNTTADQAQRAQEAQFAASLDSKNQEQLFQQQLAQANLANQMQQQGFNQDFIMQNNPYNQMNWLNQSMPSASFGGIPTAGQGTAPDLTGAGAATGASNANNMTGWFNLVGSMLK